MTCVVSFVVWPFKKVINFFCYFSISPCPVVGEPVVDEESMVVVGESFSIPRLMSSLVRGVGAAVVQYFDHCVKN